MDSNQNLFMESLLCLINFHLIFYKILNFVYFSDLLCSFFINFIYNCIISFKDSLLIKILINKEYLFIMSLLFNYL